MFRDNSEYVGGQVPAIGDTLVLVDEKNSAPVGSLAVVVGVGGMYIQIEWLGRDALGPAHVQMDGMYYASDFVLVSRVSLTGDTMLELTVEELRSMVVEEDVPDDLLRPFVKEG